MKYELIIAEKPQAAKKIAEALADKTAKKETINGIPYYKLKHNGKEIIVASAVGHLFGLAEKNKNKWSYPIFDIEWKPSFEISKKSSFTKKYYNALKKLAKNANEFTIATDFDIEGEVIGLNIIKFIANREDANRMKFSTLTKKDLVEAYEHKLKHLEWSQAKAGEARHILDWFWGINLSRALTLAVKHADKGFLLLSSGRVQGPALKLIVNKELEIKNFKPKKYWQLFLHGIFEKQKILATHVKEKFESKKDAEDIFTKIKTEKQGIIDEIKKRKFKQNPPVPFDLTTLQTEAYKCFKINPKHTLDIAQNLYTNGYISYPRTSSQKLPQKLGLKKIIQNLAKNTKYKSLAEILLKEKTLKPNEGKKEDDAHPSIFPTGIIPKSLNSEETKIYDLIAKRFLAVFGKPAVRETIKVYILVKDERFFLEGTRTLEKNWHLFYEPYVMLKEEDLPGFKEQDLIDIQKIEMAEKETSPPNRYTEASLIKALEKANLGTKATRATIVETLFQRGYATRKPLQATPLGIKTIETLEKYSPKILDEKLTSHFEEEMENIRKNKKTEEYVIDEAKKTLIKILAEFKKHELDIGNSLQKAERISKKEANFIGKCPQCGGDLEIKRSRYGRFIGCSNYPSCKVTFSLPQKGMIKSTKEVCEKCKHPIITLHFSKKRPIKTCINPKCETWEKRKKNKYKKEESKK